MSTWHWKNRRPNSLGNWWVYCRFPLIDGAGNSAAVLLAAIDTAAVLIRSQVPTLVACGAGMSRSPAIVAAAIAAIEGCSLHDALLRVAEGWPHDVSPSFLAEVAEVSEAAQGGPATR